MSNVLELPTEILQLLPLFLRDIEDFMNLSSTCRHLREVLEGTSPNQILRLAAAADRTFFRPTPYFLVAATARQVSKWALEDPDNMDKMRKAFKGGIESLHELCLQVAGLTMHDIRRLYETRFSCFNPASDLIDRVAGKQWYSVENFWDGGRSDAATIDCEPERALFQIVIYGELFASTFEAHLLPSQNLPRFDIHTRLDYIRYCIPDWIAEGGNPALPPPDKVGPYAPRGEGDPYLPADEIALQHVLGCKRWLWAWEDARLQAAPDFEEEWKQRLWQDIVQHQGVEGLQMIAEPNKARLKLYEEKDRGSVKLNGKWIKRLREIHAYIEELGSDETPRTVVFGNGQYEGSECPNLAQEVYICMMGYWRGPWRGP